MSGRSRRRSRTSSTRPATSRHGRPAAARASGTNRAPAACGRVTSGPAPCAATTTSNGRRARGAARRRRSERPPTSASVISSRMRGRRGMAEAEPAAVAGRPGRRRSSPDRLPQGAARVDAAPAGRFRRSSSPLASRSAAPAAARARPGLRLRAARDARTRARPLRRRGRARPALAGRCPHRAGSPDLVFAVVIAVALVTGEVRPPARAPERHGPRQRVPRRQPARRYECHRRGPGGHVLLDHLLPRRLRPLARRLRVLGTPRASSCFAYVAGAVVSAAVACLALSSSRSPAPTCWSTATRPGAVQGSERLRAVPRPAALILMEETVAPRLFACASSRSSRCSPC